MGKHFPALTDEHRAWIAEQHLFFVATAPLDPDGHVNLSPKGYDTFRILDPNRVAYLDLTGSGAETIAHLRDNASVQSDRQQLVAAHAVRTYLDNRLAVPDREGHPSAAGHVLEK